jgi:hypothetical protein
LCGPGRTRTCDIRFRKPAFYPLNYGTRSWLVLGSGLTTPASPQRSSEANGRYRLCVDSPELEDNQSPPAGESTAAVCHLPLPRSLGAIRGRSHRSGGLYNFLFRTMRNGEEEARGGARRVRKRCSFALLGNYAGGWRPRGDWRSGCERCGERRVIMRRAGVASGSAALVRHLRRAPMT